MNTFSAKKIIGVVSFLPDYGHVVPLLGVAREWAAAGHEIVCYLPEECRAIAGRYGLAFVSLGLCLPPDHEGIFRQLSARSDWYLTCSENWDLQLQYWLPIKIALLPAFDRLRKDLSQRPPDFILSDSHVFGEWYLSLSGALGVPLLRYYTEGTYRWCQRWYRTVNGIGDKNETAMALWEYFHRAGRSFLPYFIKLRNFAAYLRFRRVSKQISAVLAPVSCDADRPPRVVNFTSGVGVLEQQYLSHLVDTSNRQRLFFAPPPHRMSEVLPESLLAWFRGVQGSPVVYLSFGTMAQLNHRLVRALIEGIGRLDAAALWALPASQQHYLQGIEVPSTIRVDAFAPQPAVLAHPAVGCFVSHAGAGGVREGLMSGKPMLCIPFMWDQPYNASVIERLGAGKALNKREVTAEKVAVNVGDLLTEPAYRRRSEQLRQDLELHRAAHPVEEALRAAEQG